MSFSISNTSRSTSSCLPLRALPRGPFTRSGPRLVLVLRFRGSVKSGKSRTRFRFWWPMHTKEPFFSFGSSNIVSRLLREWKAETAEWLPEKHKRLKEINKSCKNKPVWGWRLVILVGINLLQTEFLFLQPYWMQNRMFMIINVLTNVVSQF